jgi:SAM-dependent methyltransferase
MSVIKSIARNLRLLLSRDIDQQLEGIRERLETRADRYEEAIDTRLETRFSAVETDLGSRAAQMAGLAGLIEEVSKRGEEERATLARDFHQQLADSFTRVEERLDLLAGGVEQHLAIVEKQLEERLTTIEQRLEERLGAIDQRIDARLEVIDIRIDQRFAALESGNDQRFDNFEQQQQTRLVELQTSLEERAGSYEEAVDQRFDERLAGLDRQVEERLGTIETRLDQRVEAIESTNDRRFDNFGAHLDHRLVEMEEVFAARARSYEEAVDQRFDERLAGVEAASAVRFSEHARAVDIRLDDRQVGIDRRIDERFNGFEKRTDTRLEAHELRIDQTLEQNRNDIIERTDLLLQVFDQRLDRLRRAGAPVDELTSGADVTIPSTVAPSLYQQIIDWKAEAGKGLDQYGVDEAEMVEYLLSFVDAPGQGYVQQHMRRYLSTLHRIPPARRSGDRLLELGSLTPLAPAIRRYCGYQEIVGTNWWPGDEKRTEKIFTQTGGGERLAIPLHNFNVETDPFPFPDGSFRVILCGELLEHLQRDPLHMLWECNRVLEDDGWLILTTPNIAGARSIEGLLTGCSPYLFSQYNLESSFDQHHREYAPREVATALTAAGFEVVKLETEDVWQRSNPVILKLLASVGLPTEERGDNIFALARKAGPPVERYPQELYIK